MAIAKDAYLLWWYRQAICRENTKNQRIINPLKRKMLDTKRGILRR